MGLPFPQPSGVNVFDGEYKQATVINRVLNRLLSNDKYVAQTVENVELTALDVTFAPGSAIRQIHQRGNNYYSMAVTSSLSSRPFSLNDLEKLSAGFDDIALSATSEVRCRFVTASAHNEVLEKFAPGHMVIDIRPMQQVIPPFNFTKGDLFQRYPTTDEVANAAREELDGYQPPEGTDIVVLFDFINDLTNPNYTRSGGSGHFATGIMGNVDGFSVPDPFNTDVNIQDYRKVVQTTGRYRYEATGNANIWRYLDRCVGTDVHRRLFGEKINTVYNGVDA